MIYRLLTLLLLALPLPALASVIVDDAPPPKAAPKRATVAVDSLPPPPGVTAAPLPAPKAAPIINYDVAAKIPPTPRPKPRPALPGPTTQFALAAFGAVANTSLQAMVTPDAALQAWVATVKGKLAPRELLQINGYARLVTNEADSRRRALQQAQAVHALLVAAGINPRQLDFKAHGNAPDDVVQLVIVK